MEQKTDVGQRSNEEKKKIKPPKGRVYIISLIGAMIFLMGAWAFSMMTGGLEINDPNIEPPTNVGSPTDNSTLETDTPNDQALIRKEGFYNFLIVGTDKGGGNTDTILLVSFDTSSRQINILQIPRDTLLHVDRPVKKINAAYAYGRIEGLKSDLTNLLGVAVDRYGIINITGFHNVVDMVGGVEVVVPEPGMFYTDEEQDLYINLKPGKQTLTGVQAEGFVRFRSGYADADLGRLKAQKAFLSSLIQKLLTPSMLAKAPQMIQNAFQNLKTDLKLEDAVYLGTQATGVQASDIRFFTLPGEGVGADYGIYKEETMEIINTYFNPYTTDLPEDKFDIVAFARQITQSSNTEGTQLADAVDTRLSHIIQKQDSGETQETENTEADADKEDTQKNPTQSEAIRIKLINTTDNENILIAYMQKLKTHGFTIVGAYNQTDKTYESTVIINTTKQNLGKNLLKYFPAALIENDYQEEVGYDLVIMLGEELN